MFCCPSFKQIPKKIHPYRFKSLPECHYACERSFVVVPRERRDIPFVPNFINASSDGRANFVKISSVGDSPVIPFSYVSSANAQKNIGGIDRLFPSTTERAHEPYIPFDHKYEAGITNKFVNAFRINLFSFRSEYAFHPDSIWMKTDSFCNQIFLNYFDDGETAASAGMILPIVPFVEYRFINTI
jgi:hypothetical protein